MNLCIVKLNGMSEAFNERLFEIAKHVNKIYLIRGNCDNPIEIENVKKYDLFPFRNEIIPRPKIYFYMIFYLIQTSLILLWLSKKGKIDIIHCFDYPIDSLAALPSKIIFNIPLIISLRGLEHIKNHPHFSLNKLLRSMTKITIRFSDHIIFKSGYQPGYVKETFNLSFSKYSVIPTGVNLDIINPKNHHYDESINEIQEKLSIPKEFIIDKKIFVFIGRISKVKGVHLLKEFITQMNNEDIRFILIGPSQDNLRIDEWSKNIENTMILSPIPFEQILHIINIADGTILLSEDKTEGAPRVLQESLAMGTPIIASNVCGIKEEFGDIQGSILIDRESFTEFKDAIEIIKNNNITVDGDKVKNRFNIEKNYEKYGEIYNNLISIR